MKSKIKIMMEGPEVTDAELEGFRDFDSLLTQHQHVAQSTSWWKWVLVIVFFLGVITAYILINPINSTSEQKSVPVISDTATATSEEMKNDSGASVTKNVSAKPVTKEQTSKKQKTAESLPEIQSVDSVDLIKTDSQPVMEKAKPVYVAAVPVAGYDSLYAYLNRELIYPAVAVKDSIQGVMMVSFYINTEGRPERIKTSGTLGKLFEAEATRLIEHMPLWKPAMVDGKPVRSKISIPLTFQLRK
jgi:TonB family protein